MWRWTTYRDKHGKTVSRWVEVPFVKAVPWT